MSDLKTLKEMEKEWMKNYGKMLLPIVNGEIELCKDLREEIMKWVIRLRKPFEYDLRFCVIYKIRGFQKKILERQETNTNIRASEILMKIFNLTQEDLKEEMKK